MAYDLYPAVDEQYQFPPEIRMGLSNSMELRNGVVPMTEAVRNNLQGAELWDGRVIVNTTTDHIERYDAELLQWHPLVNVTGDTMTGDLRISKANPGLTLNSAVPDERFIQFMTNDLIRWQIKVPTSTESGANAGSDLTILARNDAGGGLSTPVTIKRATGEMILSADGVSTKGVINRSQLRHAIGCAVSGAYTGTPASNTNTVIPLTGFMAPVDSAHYTLASSRVYVEKAGVYQVLLQEDIAASSDSMEFAGLKVLNMAANTYLQPAFKFLDYPSQTRFIMALSHNGTITSVAQAFWSVADFNIVGATAMMTVKPLFIP